MFWIYYEKSYYTIYDKIHYKALTIVINISDTSYEEIILHNDEVSIHLNHSHLCYLATDLCKSATNMNHGLY